MQKRLMVLLNLLVNIFYGRNIKITTSTGVYSLRTTFGHPLKRYLINFDNYDRFLPYLSKALAKSVIDIGANVGDTLVLIKSISNAEVICVEPDENFIRYLKRNIELNNFNSVKLYPYPISSTQKIVTIEKNGLNCTSNISDAATENQHEGILTKTFKDLVIDLSLDINTIGIIKSDTDGFDWDCLNAIADFFDSVNNGINYPEFIFYEHQTYLNNLGNKDPNSEKRGKWYENSLKRLIDHGYTEFYIFDNFGSLLCQTQNIYQLIDIASSPSKIQAGKSTSHFFDILLTLPANCHIVEKALQLKATEEMVIQ